MYRSGNAAVTCPRIGVARVDQDGPVVYRRSSLLRRQPM